VPALSGVIDSLSCGPAGTPAGSVALSLAFGLVVGFCLGLTGGGGSIFAVPLLVYGMGVPAREAVTISLAAVGATALFGFLHRLRSEEVDVRIGLLFAGAGMLGTPLGTRIKDALPGPAVLVMFAGLMVVAAARMWAASSRAAGVGAVERADGGGPIDVRRASILAGIGLATGILAGLFGVGGGFVIVPALVVFGGVPIHRAVATSLMVIALIGASGVASEIVLSGRPLPLGITGLFVAGGIGGVWLGTRLGRRLSGPALQRTFAAAMVAVAAYMLARNLAG
jgi:uncharacterized membrane protein YfcA